VPASFWWRFWPLFLAFMTPPLGIIASCIAWFKAPNDSRGWALFSLLTSVVLTGTGALAVLAAG
jgi:hypothetical protein